MRQYLLNKNLHFYFVGHQTRRETQRVHFLITRTKEDEGLRDI